VFNGFLLSANLDALFDKFLISFTDLGEICISSTIPEICCLQLGLSGEMKLRWMAPAHRHYLAFHRERFGRI
jgi:hypothetical protein